MKKKVWFIKNRRGDFKRLSAMCNISPITAKCILNRDIAEDGFKKYINGTRKDMYSPYLLPNAENAADLILDCIKKKLKIRIVGDYDMDGIGATYTFVTGIKKCGGNVDYALPHRILDGYGLNIEIIKRAIADGVQVIITCDNGIAAADAIKFAKQNGLIVIVTDHHEVPYKEDSLGRKRHIVPKADVVVDTKMRVKRPQKPYPQIGICGAEIAYKIVEILYEKKRIPKYNLDELLQVVAMSTICDVMELKDENRIVVKEGLRLINSTPIVGIKALIKASNLEGKTISAGQIGFILGPTCNASGRLDTADKAVNLFLEQDEFKALDMANELRNLNSTRQQMTDINVEKAIEIFDNQFQDDTVLVTVLPDCHESIAGIIAGRIRERYCKPTIIFTQIEDGSVKGSCRSIEAYNMFEKLTEQKTLFTKFGGHKLAAGMSLASVSDVDKLRVALNANSGLTEDDLVEITKVDMILPFHYATVELIDELSIMEPFGVANAAPLFGVKDVHITRALELGTKHNAMRYYVTSEGKKSQIYDFGNIDGFIDFLKEKYGDNVIDDINNGKVEPIVSIAYKVSINEYMGNRTPQYVIENYTD